MTDRADFRKKRLTSLPGLAVTTVIVAIFLLSAVQAGLAILHSQGVMESRYLIMSLVSMGVAGLGLIGLLLASQMMLERALSQKDKAIAMLEPRTVAMDAAMDGIAMIDASGAITYVNAMMERLYGLPGDRMTGRPWSTLYAPEQASWLLDEIFPGVEAGRNWSGQVAGLRPDGTTFFQDMSITHLRGGGKIFIIRDFTEAKKAAELSAKRLAAMEAAGDGIGIVDAGGRLTYMNGALMRLHGLDQGDLSDYIGQDWSNLYSEKGKDDILRHTLTELKRSGYWSGEAPIVRKDGTIAHAEMSLTLLPDGGMIGTARDIGDRVAAQAEKENLERQFFQAQKMEAVGRLAGGMAHDFNNILASVMGYAGFLIEDLPDGETRSFARQIMQGCQQARNLVEQILTFSRTREDKREPMDLRAAIEETTDMLRSTLPASIAVKTGIAATGVFISANAVQVRQALMNICVNARDALPDERGELTIGLDVVAGEEAGHPGMLAEGEEDGDGKAQGITIAGGPGGVSRLTLGRLQRGGHYARLSIRDNGIGTDKGVMEKMFEPFFTTKPLDLGTGLGLSAVHGIVSSHRGALTVESAVGQGTAFVLYFPLSGAAGPQAAGAAPAPAWSGSGNILVVEDQEHVREMLELMLKRLGFRVTCRPSGEEAIDCLRENPGRYDLVLSDQSMPGMNGSEMSAHIREDFPDLPIILVTGYSREHLASVMEKNPSIRAVLAKPVDVALLTRHLKEILGWRKAA